MEKSEIERVETVNIGCGGRLDARHFMRDGVCIGCSWSRATLLAARLSDGCAPSEMITLATPAEAKSEAWVPNEPDSRIESSPYQGNDPDFEQQVAEFMATEPDVVEANAAARKRLAAMSLDRPLDADQRRWERLTCRVHPVTGRAMR